MSAIPARTRSTRQPAGTASNGRPDNPSSSSSSSAVKDIAVQRRRADSVRQASSHNSSPSPSRLPTVKPLTRSNTVATSKSTTTATTTRPSRTPSISSSNVTSSISTRARPVIPQKSSPSATTRVTRAGSVSNSSNAPTSSTTMRPPPRPLRSSTTSTTSNTSMAPPSRPRSVNSTRPSNPSTSRSTGISHTRNSSTSIISSPRASHIRAPSLQTPQLTTLRHTTTDGPRSPRSPYEPKRPTFSTLQQHYSPLKNPLPKATTATILAPPTPSKLPDNIAKSAETSKLQAELLQLHLLHRDALDVSYQWHLSAKDKLHTKFKDAVATQKDLLDEEAAQQRTINVEAFRAWADSMVPGWGLEERCQVLDEVLTGVWSLSESGAKYSRVVRRFERWVDKVGDVLGAREAGVGDVEFVEGLDGAWKEDCGVMLRKLEEWKARMRDVSEGVDDKGESTLAAVVSGIRMLVEGMEEEIIMMERMQREVVEREEGWIRAQNDEDDLDDERSRAEGVGNHHGIWRI